MVLLILQTGPAKAVGLNRQVMDRLDPLRTYQVSVKVFILHKLLWRYRRLAKYLATIPNIQKMYYTHNRVNGS
ncbi:hypothetical protein Bca4012_019970 [Brassica carinata]